MRTPSRLLLASGFGALLLVVGLAFPFVARAAGDFAADGYLSADREGCLLLKQHDGRVLVLAGATDGLESNDHVRLLGHNVDGTRCTHNRGQAYEVTEVQAIWANDNHTKTYYDHLVNGSFERWLHRRRH